VLGIRDQISWPFFVLCLRFCDATAVCCASRPPVLMSVHRTRSPRLWAGLGREPHTRKLICTDRRARAAAQYDAGRRFSALKRPVWLLPRRIVAARLPVQAEGSAVGLSVKDGAECSRRAKKAFGLRAQACGGVWRGGPRHPAQRKKPTNRPHCVFQGLNLRLPWLTFVSFVTYPISRENLPGVRSD
jgi:hypothetical protein